MNDFESRLHDTLDGRSHQAPDASDLASGARRRMRRRRTARTVVAAAVVAVALPIGFSQFGGLGSAGSDKGTTVASSENSGIRTAADGFRYETWHGVSVQVPIDWEPGAASAWCSGVDTPEEVTPVVTRPDTMGIRIFCDPASGYGITFASPGPDTFGYDRGGGFGYVTKNTDKQRFPQGAWVGSWFDDDGAVTVVTPDRDLTQRIIDSATKVDEADPNGCPIDASVKEWPIEGIEGVSLCRYDEDNRLVVSGFLVGEQATAAMRTMSFAPQRKRELRSCLRQMGAEGYLQQGYSVVFQDGDWAATIRLDACAGVSLPGEPGVSRGMTDEIRALIDPMG